MNKKLVRALAFSSSVFAIGHSTSAMAQLDFTTYQFGTSVVTTVTGIRGDNMTGNFTTGSGGNTGGLLFGLSDGAIVPGNIAPFPTATANLSNYPGAISSTPYGPSFGSSTGILRVAGSYKTTASSPNDLGYLFDAAAAPGQQLTTLLFPSLGGATTLNTLAHSNFGNQAVGNYDTILATGNAFIYTISTGTYATNNVPGALSTTAYGVYGNRIAGGYADSPTTLRAYIYNQDTQVFTTYNAPGGSVVTHFEGITSGGLANTYNLVADSVDVHGDPHAWAVHVDSAGVATWTEIAVPGASVTSANSIYGNEAIGVYVLNGVTYAYTTTIPGIYTPITNSANLSFTAPNALGITSASGDDVVNTGTVTMTGAGSIGISGGTYGVVTNTGTIDVSGAGSTAVQMTSTYGTLLNSGVLRAAPGGFAIQTDGTAVGTLVVNTGVIDGQVAIAAGPLARFENSGWMGISTAGAGTQSTISGTFAQTATGILSLRVSPTASDSLLVDGVARLGGTVQAVFQSGTSFAKSYTILTATGGLTGSFSALSTLNLPAFFAGNLTYTGTDVSLNVRAASGSLPGLGSNQQAVGRVLDNAFNNGPGLDQMSGLFSVSAAQLPGVLTTLSGSSASVGQSAMLSAGSQFTSFLTSRADTRAGQQADAGRAGTEVAEACDAPVACDMEHRWSAWASGFGGAQWTNADSKTGASAAQQTIAGGAFGSDYRAGTQTYIGFAGGVSSLNYSVPNNGATGQATGEHFGIYGLQGWDTIYVSGSLTYSRFDGTATRSIVGIGPSETERSSSTSNQLASHLEIGRSFDTGGAKVTPFFAIEPAQLWQPGYTETSVTANGTPGVFGLTYQPQGTTSLPTVLGAQVDGETELNARALKGWVRIAWVHELLANRSVTAGFNTLPGNNFTVDGATAASDAMRFNFGGSYAVAAQTSLFANGTAELSDRGQSIGGTAGIRLTW
jgi:subtilase-type serine protease